MLGIVASLLSSFTWALGSTAYARASHRHTAFTINLTRSLGAAPLFILFAVCWGDWSTLPVLWGSTAFWLCLSVLSSYGVGDLIFLAAAKRVGVPGALAIGSIFPIWNTLLGAFLRGEFLDTHQIVGLALTLCFLVVVILSGTRGTIESRSARAIRERAGWRRLVWGVVFALLTSVFWATNSFCIAQAGGRMDPWIANSFRMLVAIAMSSGLGFLVTRRITRPLPGREWRSALPVYLFEAFGGSALYVYGLSHTSMALGATLSSLAPVMAVPIAWVTRTEKVSWLRLSGVCGVMFGLWLLLLP